MDVDSLTEKFRGKFVVFDGPDGCGKTTQRDRLYELLMSHEVETVCCQDPGGTVIGDRIRSVLLDYDLSTMNVNCEALLFMASRAQLVAEVVKPAMAAGKTVLCDRFVTATCAYQGAAGYDPKRVIELAHFAIDDCWPDVSVILDVDVNEGFERIGRKSHHAGKHRKRSKAQGMTLFDDAAPDAMEARSIEFHRRVREMFLTVHTYYPKPVVHVDANGDSKKVYGHIVEQLERVAF